MPITSITIENFKGIADEVTIPIRPITLLFGKNSAGKSTVLQALHYMREVLEHRRPDPDRTQMGGDYIDLGGFQSLVHRNELDRKIRIRVEFDIDDDGIPSNTPIESIDDSPWSGIQDINDGMDINSAWIEIQTAWDAGKDKGAFISDYAIGLNKAEIIRLRQSFGLQPELTHIKLPKPLFEKLQEMIDSEDISPDYSEDQNAESPITVTNDPKLFSRPIILTSQESIIPNSDKPYLLNQDFPNDQTDLSIEELVASIFRHLWDQALTGSLQILLEELKGIRYLGPIREVPPRNYRTPKTPDESRWAKGLGAWDALERDDQLVTQVNDYIQNVLELRYSINRRERVSLDLDGDIMSSLRLLAVRMQSRFEDMDADELQGMVIDPIEQLPRQIAIQLYDETNGIDVDPHDIGIGISQVIPVVVGALDSGAQGHRCRIFAVEQPELHVHPAVQVALGDVFIDAVKTSERRMLVETHSEHLLLRIMRRMRETFEDKIEEGRLPVTPGKVCILFIEQINQKTIIREMPLNERGELVKAWPGGFFEEGIEEVF